MQGSNLDTSKSTTPMMDQWAQCKKQAKDALLLFRLGDFYEAFHEDASILAEALDLTLTKRHDIPMSGIPCQSAQSYIEKLVHQGFLVAVAEQTEDPREAKGIVKREIVQIISPSTIVNSSSMDDKENNYLASLTGQTNLWGLSFLDITTGQFFFIETQNFTEIIDEIYRRKPAEILISQKDKAICETSFAQLKWQMSFQLRIKDSMIFHLEMAREALLQHFGVISLSGFGLGESSSGLCSSGALISYVKDELLHSLSHVRSLRKEPLERFMAIDLATQRNLELLNPQKHLPHSPTLLSLMDETVTPMGGRLLRTWVSHPLRDPNEILPRQKAIKDLLQCDLSSLRAHLKKIRDMERLMMRICMNQCSPKDLVALRFSLERIPVLIPYLQQCSSEITQQIIQSIAQTQALASDGSLTTIADMAPLIARSISDEPPLRIGEGQLFKKGYNQQLDALYDLCSNARRFIVDYQTELREKLGIKTLRVSYNRAFGYFIEVSRAQAEKVPQEFVKRQTLVNTERFISPQLKEFETKILSADEQITSMENTLYNALKSQICHFKDAVISLAENIALLDVFANFAFIANKYSYVCPQIDHHDVIQIDRGRHPVIESTLPSHTFIANDIHLDRRGDRLHILTGPNMAGKSTFIRQVALIVIMAQIGSFVPAKTAKIGAVDKLFSRIGASDDLSRGHSTFMVEMMETANILNNATKHSLVILDEIGRGTSTYDGIAIARATSEYLLHQVQAKTLFATHYWELTELEQEFQGVKNFTVAIEENHDEIVFLRKIIPGSSNRSYGIHVGKLAGLPREVINRAEVLLSALEKKQHSSPQAIAVPFHQQLPLFPKVNHHKQQVLDQIQTIDINNLTPLQALQCIVAWKDEIQ